MNRRDRILTAISHREPDRVPVGFDIISPLKEELLRHYGIPDMVSLYEKTGIEGFSVWDWPSVLPTYTGPPREGVVKMDASHGCWGKESEKVYPMQRNGLDDYVWPRLEDFDFSTLSKRLREVKEKDMTSASGHAGVGFTHHYQLRSYDNALMDILDDTWMDEYMHRNREFFVPYFQSLFQNAGGHIDIIRADEDLGGNENMLISPAMWRRWYKPLWKEVLSICRDNGAKVWFHSCGYCRDLVEDFIEIGVDVLNPIPPYVRGSDPLEMKRTYGDRLSFDGGVDQINVLVKGTPDQVREEVRLRLGQLAPGGGYILGPSQVFSRDVPLENVLAFFDAALEFGRY
ncbi:MAG: uroporphyrinogen decarboxylase family protein [Clostridia bacterium]